MKPDRVLVNGGVETHPEGSYSIEWYDDQGKRRRVAVGKNAADAQAAKQRQEQILATQALGIEVVDPDGAGRVPVLLRASGLDPTATVGA